MANDVIGTVIVVGGGIAGMQSALDLANTGYYVYLVEKEEESCGQCNPCREGLKQMLDILTRICNGDGRQGDIETLEELGVMMQKFSLCGMGTSAPNPVLTSILYFREEYEAHIRDKKCSAGVCKPLFHYEIDPDTCTGCRGNADLGP